MLPDRGGPVAGLVLAAGGSSRMGTNKLLLPFEGETVLRRSVRRALAAALSPVVVVLGYEADRAIGELRGLACQPVLNPDHARGMNGSIRTGVAAVPAGASAVVVLLADMPLVTSRMIAEVVERHRGDGAALVVSTYGDVVAPPMLYHRSLFPELGALDGDGCGKRVYKRHREAAIAVPQPADALADLDQPGDYARLRSRAEG